MLLPFLRPVLCFLSISEAVFCVLLWLLPSSVVLSLAGFWSVSHLKSGMYTAEGGLLP